MIRDTLHTAGEIVALALFCVAVAVWFGILVTVGG